ncbi:hypothetical protein D9613_012046 [Agrocybe pediades]|uniref:Cysteine protease n=1 Tax=Agrocybe pediades TaxID=84607 RepID=A0A8H4VHT8_9AGAR|nr:hypothetical protein D9613_012046 [Agrocybe pediades]
MLDGFDRQGAGYGCGSVTQWFGPSVAVGAIRTLTTAFLECGLSIAVTVDSTLYQNQVLGIEGVNPIYYDTIKSVGISGGHLSSSYYFVGSQVDNLFYLDPHPPPKDGVYEGHIHEADRDHSEHVTHLEKEKDRSGKKKSREKDRDREKRTETSTIPQHCVPTLPLSTRDGLEHFTYHVLVSPSPLQQQYLSSSADSSVGAGRSRGHDDEEDSEEELEEHDCLVSGDGESGGLPLPDYQQVLSSSSVMATTLGGRGAQGQMQAPPSSYRPQSHQQQQQQQQQQHVNTGGWCSASAGPMTPGPGSKFDIVSPPRRGKGKGDEEGDLAFRAEDDDGFGEDDKEEESEIEDDWVDPSLLLHRLGCRCCQRQHRRARR